MNLPIQDQVCSPELAKKLMELGLNEKYKSHFRYSISVKEDGAYVLDFIKNLKYPHSTERIYSQGELGAASLVWAINPYAYTIAELGEILPETDDNKPMCVSYGKEDGAWWCEVAPEGYTYYAEKEADSRAKILIYLLGNKFMEL